MLAQQPYNEKDKVIKQGWVLKKGGAGLLAPWRQKYLALVSTKNGNILWIYNDRDLTKPPKHEIKLSDMRIDSKAEKYLLLPKNAVSFKLVTVSRKFYLAANTRGEFEEWMGVFGELGHSHGHNHNGELYHSAGGHDVRGEISRSFMHLMRTNSRIDDSDARSVYSVVSRDEEDDTFSIVSGSSRGTSLTDRETTSITTSNFDTLSFCSEPVLTPFELTLMGNEKEDHIEETTYGNPLVREKAVLVKPQGINESNWHQKYIEILNIRAITEEAILSKDVQLMQLIGSFQETSTYHAKQIIDEFHVLENSEKCSMKLYKQNNDFSFQKNGIAFRFACDYFSINFLTKDCDEQEIKYALQKSSAELRGNAAIIQAIFDRKISMNDTLFYTILMTLIDYKGFRIIAHAELSDPNNVKGIHDLNPRRYKIDESICQETLPISNYLFLKPHLIQVNDDRRVRVCLSATAENLYYLTCLRDLFPLDSNFVQRQIDPQTENSDLKNFKRLRPEFLQSYQTLLCSDAFTPLSGGSKREMETNDEELIKASRFLRENWIPGFVKMLDKMEVCPFDSESLTKEMHKKGINMRYLGFIYIQSTIPFVRHLVLVEMIARVCKNIFQQKIRNSILHFRKVGATSIDKEMETYVANLFNQILGNSPKTLVFVDTKIKNQLKTKFNMDLTEKQFLEIPKPALFLALQYHCAVTLVDIIDYDFQQQQPFSRDHFESFDARVKTLQGIYNETKISNTKDDDKLAYMVAKHFKSIGPKSKLVKSNSTAVVLLQVSANYNHKNRFEEARLYAQAAVSSSKTNTALFGLSVAQLLYAIAGLQSSVIGGPDPTLLGLYRKALNSISWHWGEKNPLTITLHDRMSEIYHRAKDPERAFQFHMASLDTAKNSLGNTHIVTACYLARAGCYLSNMGKTEEAIEKFTLSLEIFQSSRSDNSLIAEVYYHYADALEQRGDYVAAVENAQKCRRMRETSFGFSDIRVINSCRQVSKMILSPYKDYNGILTPAIKAAYREAISCNEKIFRYLQNQLSRRKSSRRHSRRISTNIKTNDKKSKIEISGPLLEQPFGWTPPFAKNLLHKLTKDIVQMKLQLVESPKHKECIRSLRSQKNDIQSMGFDVEDARNTILKMAAVTPSVYLDDILQRIGHGDSSAVEELGMVIILTETETVSSE